MSRRVDASIWEAVGVASLNGYSQGQLPRIPEIAGSEYVTVLIQASVKSAATGTILMLGFDYQAVPGSAEIELTASQAYGTTLRPGTTITWCLVDGNDNPVTGGTRDRLRISASV